MQLARKDRCRFIVSFFLFQILCFIVDPACIMYVIPICQNDICQCSCLYGKYELQCSSLQLRSHLLFSGDKILCECRCTQHLFTKAG